MFIMKNTDVDLDYQNNMIVNQMCTITSFITKCEVVDFFVALSLATDKQSRMQAYSYFKF